MKIEQGEIGQAREVLGKVQQALDRAESETRRAIASLEENLPLRFTLQEQLESLVEEFNQKHRGVRWQTNLTAPLLIPPRDAEQVLRVVREALQNACHHSGASVITLILERIDGHAQVQVLDDGHGFDPEKIPEDDPRGHFGLKIMRARAARLGGELEVCSTAGQGTQVRLTWPLVSQGEEP
jgi:signal transduction histidine kinase